MIYITHCSLWTKCDKTRSLSCEIDSLAKRKRKGHIGTPCFKKKRPSGYCKLVLQYTSHRIAKLFSNIHRGDKFSKKVSLPNSITHQGIPLRSSAKLTGYKDSNNNTDTYTQCTRQGNYIGKRTKLRPSATSTPAGPVFLFLQADLPEQRGHVAGADRNLEIH